MAFAILTNRDKRILNALTKIAVKLEPVKSSRIAAALVYKNDIISIGTCSYRTHTFQSKFTKNPHAIHLHAETDAIRQALNSVHPDELKKATLYIQRSKLDRNKKWVNGSAKPCSGCLKAIIQYDIKRVIYSTETDSYEELI